MSMDGNGLSVADALALVRDGNGMFGDGNGSWIFFLFFLLAWGGNFGNWGGNGMNSTANAYTDSAIQRGFDNQSVTNKLNGLESGYLMAKNDFPLMRDEFVGAVNNRPYSFN